jgi:integrase
MALIKRGNYWHYEFVYRGKRYQGSTDQTNINKAKLTESKLRSDAALEHFGLAPPKQSPMFKEFMEGRFLDHVRQHNAEKPRTVAFYEEKTKRLLEHLPFTRARLSEIDEGMVAEYQQIRVKMKRRHRTDGLVSASSANRELAALRKALYLAYEWKLIVRRPKFRILPGEKNREYVVTGEVENAYLSKAQYPLKEAAILILDLGLRPEECVALRKSDILETAVCVPIGKTKNAVRAITLSTRARVTLELLFALWPNSEWVFPGRRKGQHLTRSALDNMHAAIRDADGSDFSKDFVLYSLRHTFGTRLAESGASPFDIKSLMGHSDVRVSQKYVHPTPEHIERAMKRKELFDRTLRGEGAGDPAILADRAKIGR